LAKARATLELKQSQNTLVEKMGTLSGVRLGYWKLYRGLKRFEGWGSLASSSVEFCIEKTTWLLCSGGGEREIVVVWETVKNFTVVATGNPSEKHGF
jgi:hypothetical protein